MQSLADPTATFPRCKELSPDSAVPAASSLHFFLPCGLPEEPAVNGVCAVRSTSVTKLLLSS